VASLSQGRTAAAQCGLFTYKSVPVIFEPPCIYFYYSKWYSNVLRKSASVSSSSWRSVIYVVEDPKFDSSLITGQVHVTDPLW